MHFVPEWEEEFDKPIMIDECRYEVNMDFEIRDRQWNACIGKNPDESYILIYFGDACPAWRYPDMLPEGKKYRAEIIDVWDMTITPVEEIFDKKSTLNLRSKKYIAIRLIESK